MQNLGKYTMQKIVIVLALFFTFLQAASVEATVSNTEIVQGNMVQLKITAQGNRAEFPNIGEIEGAPILGRHQGQNNSISYINGSMSSKHTTTLILTFSPQHDMTVPSYAVSIDGSVYKTNPIDIKIIKSTAPRTDSSNRFSLQMRVDKKTVMVGEPVLLTVYFSMQNGVHLSENPQYDPPEFKGFFVKALGKEKNYREGNRQVTELRYLLTPKKEGNFTVEPATAKVGVADTSRRDMFGRFFGTSWVPIVSNSVDIIVKKTGEDTDLVGTFFIENSLDKNETKANKPVNLTVKIEGEGNLEDFDFPDYEIDNVTIYSDDAKVETEIIGQKLKSTYAKSFAFISDTDFTIPAKIISVYDTKSDKVKILKIPAYFVHIDVKKGVSLIPKSTSTTSKKAVVETNIKQPESILKEDESKENQENTVPWWILVFTFLLGVLFMYLLKYLPKFKSKQSPFKESEALKILYAHMNESREVEEMVRKLYAKKNGDKNVQIDKKLLKLLVEKYRT